MRVIPLSSRSEIVGEYNGALKIKLTSAPIEGAANEELIKVLAKAFAVSRSSVEILSGHASKTKTVQIRGATSEKIAAVLQPKS